MARYPATFALYVVLPAEGAVPSPRQPVLPLCKPTELKLQSYR